MMPTLTGAPRAAHGEHRADHRRDQAEEQRDTYDDERVPGGIDRPHHEALRTMLDTERARVVWSHPCLDLPLDLDRIGAR